MSLSERYFNCGGRIRGGVLFGLREAGPATQEEPLADELGPIGDFVAIGQPGEELPTPGAMRIYASDAEWKEIVKAQMRIARLVIMRAGIGENLFRS